MLRITITLTRQEQEALIALAEKDRRHPRDQAALIIRHELEKRGFIKTDVKQSVIYVVDTSVAFKELSAIDGV